MAEIYRSPAGRHAVQRWCDNRLDRWAVPHDRLRISTSAGETHLLTAGSGETGVLFFPGTNFSAAACLPLAGALAARHRVVVADVPGQPGLSSGRRPGGDRLAAYGTWASELVAHLAMDRLVLVGHSLGGAIALSCDPAGVNGLVLLDPAGLIRLRVTAGILGATLPWLVRPTPARSAALLRRMLATGHEPSATHVEWMTLTGRHTRSSGAPSPLPPAVVERWRGVPRAVLVGQQDCFLPADPLRTAVRDRLGVNLGVVGGAGHLTTEECPDHLAGVVERLSAGG